jgi:hypothetical protein
MENKEVGKHHSWRMVMIGSIILVFLVQFMTFTQGFYIAMAGLDYRQSMIMLRPTFLYATPFYFLLGRGIAIRARRYLFYPFMVVVITVLFNAVFYYYFYDIPLTFYAVDPTILLLYFFVTMFGGIIGNKTRKL